MRFGINNANGTFYMDLNGFQLTKRRTNDKISLPGNFYPIPTTAVLLYFSSIISCPPFLLIHAKTVPFTTCSYST